TLPGAISDSASRRANPALLKAAGLLVAVGVIAYGAWIINTRPTAPAVEPPPLPTTNVAVSPSPKPQPPQWYGLETGSPVELQKAGQGSLVYAVGVLHNTTDQQKFGVKVEIDLFDAHGAKVGVATDYTQTIDAGAQWHFHALVVATGAAKAKI